MLKIFVTIGAVVFVGVALWQLKKSEHDDADFRFLAKIVGIVLPVGLYVIKY